MCGVFILKDLYKTKVYDLCNWINNKQSCFEKIQQIPVNIINKEPTAELKFEQKDSDSLPPYEVLDKILELLIDKNEDLINHRFGIQKIKLNDMEFNKKIRI